MRCWQAQIAYLTDTGLEIIQRPLENLSELKELLEQSGDGTLHSVVITNFWDTGLAAIPQKSERSKAKFVDDQNGSSYSLLNLD